MRDALMISCVPWGQFIVVIGKLKVCCQARVLTPKLAGHNPILQDLCVETVIGKPGDVWFFGIHLRRGFHGFPITKDISGSHLRAGLIAASAFSS